MTIGDRFKLLRAKLGLNQSELAREIGANPSIISDIERGDKEPSKKIISSLILKYRVNSNWLLTERGDIFVKEALTAKSPLEQNLDEIIAAHPKFAAIEERLARLEASVEDKGSYAAPETGEGGGFTGEPEPEYEVEERVKIPYVENIAAGPPITQSEDLSGTVPVPARFIRKGFRYYAASIRGTSMAEAGIRDGDLVLIRSIDTPVDGAIQVVRYQGKSTLKRLREREDKGWELHYEDGSGKVIPVGDSEDYEIQGEFVAVLPGAQVPDRGKRGPRTREEPFKNR
ncbi:MAG: XRE family transcriptional regulator [Treponema sp.]|jgi:SOS-response transcriptional repressor LexA|nr:XRE family transcriptional regulator [Treponema sp.]